MTDTLNIEVKRSNLTDEEWEELKRLAKKGAKKFKAEGDWIICSDGSIVQYEYLDYLEEYHKTGMVGKTKEEAEEIRDWVFKQANLYQAWRQIVGDWRKTKGKPGAIHYITDNIRFSFETVSQRDEWIELIEHLL